ncbi:long-chain fatty acid--CoA ligase [Candidatus Woesearchaeota archaeon]|nr:long-chain fatty acid--CoA ligase [Candidatus Woesearchaeota archaeon]
MSIYHIIKKSIAEQGDKAALSTKDKDGKYQSISYKDLGEMIDSFASGLVSLGIGPKGSGEVGDRVAVMSENRAEFIAADLANYALGNITVPIYTTYTSKKIKEILEDAGAKAVIVSNKANYETVLEALEGKDKKIISMQKISGVNTSFEDVMNIGRKSPQDLETISKNVKDDDLAMLIYTSGTTGQPKGAMLTHANIMSNILAIKDIFPTVSSKDKALSIIPYSHAFEHTGALSLLYIGAEIGFAENTNTVATDLVLFKPTIMLAVPRLYEKVLDKIKMGLEASKFKKKMFNTAMETKEKYLKALESGKKPGFILAFMNKKLDHLVFQKVREKTGGNLEFCITGGGPLSSEIEDLFSRKIGIALYNGYGLTETAPVISANTPQYHKKGSIGKPVPAADVQIIDGEIAVAGPMVFKGYWKDDEKTKKVFTVHKGKTYFLTGDKGKLDNEGYLYIMGRMKNDIRLNTGQNIGLAEELEEPLKASTLISQVMVHGQAEPYITGLVIPNYEYLKATMTLDEQLKDEELEKYFKSMQDLSPEHPMPYEERISFAANKKVKELISKEVNRINKGLGLEDYASLTRFTLLPSDFSQQCTTKVNGKEVTLPDLLTPTLKIKRANVLDYYKELFDKMYKR